MKNKTYRFAAALAILLALALVFVAPVSADAVATLNGQSYETLQDAITAANSGNTITLLSNIESGDTITISKTITLDLNGKTLKGPTTGWVIKVDCSSTLTVTDNSVYVNGNISGYGGISVITGSNLILNNGNIVASGDYGVQVYGSSATMNGGSITSDTKCIVMFSNGSVRGTFIMTGGKVTSTNGVAISANGGAKYDKTDATISGGEVVSSNSAAIYWPSNGNLIINGGTIKGKTAVYFKSGSLSVSSINGGNLIGTGEYEPYIHYGNGCFATGDALVIENVNAGGYEGITSVSITGGTFTSTYAKAVASYVPVDNNSYRYKDNNGNYVDRPITEHDNYNNLKDAERVTAFITGGTYSSDVSEYVAEDYICKKESAGKFIVTEIPDEAVVPEKPVVDTQEEDDGSTTITPSTEADSTPINQADGKTDEVVIGYEDSDAVIIRLTGVTVSTDDTSGDVTSVTVPIDAKIIAEYKEDAVNGAEDGTTFTLELKIEKVDASLPVIDSTIQEDILGDNQPEHNVLAMITAINADKNDNIKEDGKAITIKFKIPEVAVKDKSMLRAYHVDIYGDPELLPNLNVDGPNEGFYTVTIYGSSFSSYVLVEEEPQENLGGGSATDTGSGNYQYYPRSVPTDGIVDFGTSRVVTGMELPAGSDGTVTLNIKPTFTMPENGFYAFEIDAPGYNLDAKINGGLSFQIPVADLEAAGWTAEDIVLFHGTVAEDGKITWEALPTNLVKVENGIAYYKAAINGCSPFYIGFVEDGSIVNTEVVDPVTPPTDEPDVPGEVLPEIPPVDEPETPETPESPAPVLGLIAALGAAVVLRRK